MKYKQLTLGVCLVFVLTLGCAEAQSLFNATTYKPLVTDVRGLKLGDIVTVIVYESASATTSTDSAARKSSNVGLAAGIDSRNINGNVDLSNGFDGGGSLSRAGEIVARVSVTITEILANGEMLIRGEQKIELNNESQNIYVEGRVREQDISSDNTIISSRIADANIRYMGEGLLSNREKPGIITRLFNYLF